MNSSFMYIIPLCLIFLQNKILTSDVPYVTELQDYDYFTSQYYDAGTYYFSVSTMSDRNVHFTVISTQNYVGLSYSKFSSRPLDSEVDNSIYYSPNINKYGETHYYTVADVNTGNYYYVVFKVETSVGQYMEIEVQNSFSDSGSVAGVIFFSFFFFIVFVVILVIALRRFCGFLRFRPQTTSLDIVANTSPQPMYSPPVGTVGVTPVVPVGAPVAVPPQVYYPPPTQVGAVPPSIQPAVGVPPQIPPQGVVQVPPPQQPPMYIPPAQGF